MAEQHPGFQLCYCAVVGSQADSLVVNIGDNQHHKTTGGWKQLVSFIYIWPFGRSIRDETSLTETNSVLWRICGRFSVHFRKCTNIAVDESKEANPLHLIGAITRYLEDLYTDTHENNVLAWKQVDELPQKRGSCRWCFQWINRLRCKRRWNEIGKFPTKDFDSLYLSMEAVEEQYLRNAVGQRRQELNVCAIHVDKAPTWQDLREQLKISLLIDQWFPTRVCKKLIFSKVYLLAPRRVGGKLFAVMAETTERK